MADRIASFNSLKAAASNHESQLQSATTKEDALRQALAAAEQLMGAMKLAPSPAEKKIIKERFNAVADTAEDIRSNNWSPTNHVTTSSAQPQQLPQPEIKHTRPSRPKSKADEFGVWAAHITKAHGSDRPGASTTSGTSQRPIPDDDGTSSLSLERQTTRTWLQNIIEKERPATRIRKLREPVSSRKRKTKEDIILLKASLVNGVKCPPWDRPPNAAEFDVGQTGHFTQPRELSLSPQQQQYFKAWARTKDAISPPSANVDGNPSSTGPVMSSPYPVDLVQDAATDCSVVASLCAGVARAARGYEEILSTRIYPFDQTLGTPVITSNGKYVVRLNFNGCWRRVTIDDRLPLSESRSLHVSDRRNPALLWPALLEKAYLTVRGGYDFPGSNSCSDLWTLTGWIPEQIHLQVVDIILDQLWNRLYIGFMFGDVLATLGTSQMSTRQERELGLESQHSYVVLDMKQVGDDRFLLVKNPWVAGRGWLGPYPPQLRNHNSSPPSNGFEAGLSSYHQDAIPTQKHPHPTTFWIAFEQVIRHFESLYLNWNPGLFRHRQDIHFEWAVDGPGEMGNKCIVGHPQFLFHSKDGGLVWFLLTRHFREMPRDSKEESDAFNDGSIRPDISKDGHANKGYMNISLYAANGNRLYMKGTALEESDYVTTPHCLLRWYAEADTTYTVVLDQEELPASSYTLSLSAFSHSELQLEPAVLKYPQQQVVSGEWTKQTAGGSTGSSHYFKNPQYALEVKKRGCLAILLTSPSPKNALHVKLTLGLGKRIYSVNRRDVLADSGDHSTKCVLAETLDVEPGIYTVVCSLFEAGHTGNFTLRVDSTSDFSLRPIPRDGAGLLVNRLAPVCFRPNVHEIAAPLLARRLASYTIVVHYLRTTTPRSAGPAARSPLRFSVECGRGPGRAFLITSEGGQYSDATMLRTQAVNIDPASYPANSLYLVLDRLSGPGGAVEEWYEVEVYSDVPGAYEIGDWQDRK